MELGDAPSTWLEGAVVTSRPVRGMPGPADAVLGSENTGQGGSGVTE